MKKIALVVFLVYSSLFHASSQMNNNKDLQSQDYNRQLEKAQNYVLNAIDTNELKFALWMNESFEKKSLSHISEIYSIPYLKIHDNCFVALDCDYSIRNFLYCIDFHESHYREYFICLNGDNWLHFIYNSKDITESTYSDQLYMYTDICEITDLVKFKNNGIVKIARNLCFLDEGELYTFQKGMPILLHEFYADWKGHNPHYIDGCIMPQND